jgi:hypothetical protein
LCRDVYVEYQFYLDQTKYKTKVCTGKNRNQDIDYKHQHTVEIVTKMLVEYLEKDVMVFRVYGFADVKPKSKNNVKKPTQAKKPVTAVAANNSSYMDDPSTDTSLDTSATSVGRVANAVTVQSNSTAIQGSMRTAPVVNDPLAAQRATGM